MNTDTSNNSANTEVTITELPSNALPISATIKEAWGYVSGFKSTYWLAMLILFATSFVFGFIQGIPKGYLKAEEHAAALSGATINFLPAEHHLMIFVLCTIVISNIINVLMSYGILYLGIRRTANLPIMTRMMFRSFKSPLVFRLLGLALIKLIFMLSLGLLLIGISATIHHTLGINASHAAKFLTALIYILFLWFFIYLFLRISLSTLAVLDKKLNPFAAIAFSFKATTGKVWRIFWINFQIMLIVLVSIIPLGIGLIWSFPLTVLILPTIYKKLVGISMTE